MLLRPRALTLYATLSLILIVLIGASAYSLTKYLRFRENQRIVEQEQLLEIQHILDRCRDQVLRHPDYDLQRQRAFLTSFALGSPKDQLRDRAKLEGFSQELEETLLFRAAGIELRDGKYSEASRYKTYSPNGFKGMYEQLDYPRTTPILNPPPITGVAEADDRIVDLAVRRGYRLRRQAKETALISDGRDVLQDQAMAAWREMQSAARAEGVRLELVSAYRSVDRQRQIFLSELRNASIHSRGREYTTGEIASGGADEPIDRILRYSSIPGFSKHHSGYTIDVTDPSEGYTFTDFEQTQGFTWISAHNYLNAKRFGFIPSYPAGAAKQGPEPEPWEYVWVGRQRLLAGPSVRK
jgi:D-alanyl-D-alanine carboxypeptidase